MINQKGKFFSETLISLGLKGDDADIATTNAHNIISKIVTSYENLVGKDHVGQNGKGIPITFKKSTMGPIGLVYGRIQSGKTRAMITSTAMAFDNSFRIAVVMTSNINDLVSQTHMDFSRDLKGVSVFSKDDELRSHVEDAKLDLASDKGRILIITSKGGNSLKNVIDFLDKIEAKKFPLVIFDDEGDQASLDTNTYKRTSTGNLTLEKSTINKLIVKMRQACPASVYVSVTGTPQSVLLQTASSDNRPLFIEMLPAGGLYIGGDYFFGTDEPENNKNHLISIIPSVDKNHLLNTKKRFPEGLRDALLFFLLSASAAKEVLGFPDNNRGYQFLCHPSLKNEEQTQAKNRISSYLTEIKKILLGHQDVLDILPAFNKQYEELKKQLGDKTPPIEKLKEIIDDELRRKKILVINASNSKRRGIEYGPGFNFLIGGNTLGRGIAIPNLLVTYYVRDAVTSQMDTMHQHARMFGYRQKTLPYTRLFITRTLYYRFRDIHQSDYATRTFIQDHQQTLPNAFPIDTSIGLRPTRKGVLDVNSVEFVAPGMQIYPNKMKLPQSKKNFQTIFDLLFEYFAVTTSPALIRKGKEGITISLAEANKLLSLIKTQSKNVWNDNTIQTVLTKLSNKLHNKIRLKYRSAERTIQGDGQISSGTLSGGEQGEARADQYPTLWIMDVTVKKTGSPVDGEQFIFPTIVVPTRLGKMFVFSKK